MLRTRAPLLSLLVVGLEMYHDASMWAEFTCEAPREVAVLFSTGATWGQPAKPVRDDSGFKIDPPLEAWLVATSYQVQGNSS